MVRNRMIILKGGKNDNKERGKKNDKNGRG